MVNCSDRQERSDPCVIIYDNRFNANEWFVLSALCTGLLTIFLLPRRFRRKRAIIYFLCGVYTGFFFDQTLSLPPFGYYDVNDTSNYNIMDFISYWMYGPYSYLFFYVLDFLKLKAAYCPVYIVVCSAISVFFEWIAMSCGVFHYLHGYSLYVSFPIYLVVQSIWVLLFYRLRFFIQTFP
jgi:hypothetical protein